MSAHGEPEGGVPRVGVGEEPPTQDFGPRPLVSEAGDEERTQSRPYPEHPQPQYADPSQSGPQQVQPGAVPHQGYVEQTPSGSQAAVSGPYQVPQGSGPHYVEQTPSGPQAAASGPPQGSGPHQVPQGSGPYQVPQGSGPHYVDQTPSGSQPVPQQYVNQQQYPQQPQQPYPPRQTAQQAHGHAELSSQKLIKQAKRAPQAGWRKAVFVASGRLINPGESPAETHRRELIGRVNQPLRGCYKIAMLSLKGGVGKTTTTVGLGSTLASLRGDRVLAVDANPDRGTLSDKVRLETAATVRDLLNERGQIERYADVRAFTSQAPSRLEVLASDRDPTVSVAFSEEDYCEVSTVLEHYYSICLTDCGTGLLHSAMAGVLCLADQIVLVSSTSVDGARSASATLDWLAAHAYADLVRGAVVVLSIVRPSSRNTVDLDRLEQHFAARCRAVTRIPYDAHLEEGAEVELDQLSRATADAYLELAAIVGDGLAWPRSIAQHGAAAGTARRDGREP